MDSELCTNWENDACIKSDETEQIYTQKDESLKQRPVINSPVKSCKLKRHITTQHEVTESQVEFAMKLARKIEKLEYK